MSTQGPKSEPPDSKNNPQNEKKLPLRFLIVFPLCSNAELSNPARPASPASPTVRKFSSLPIAEGAGGRGEALRYVYEINVDKLFVNGGYIRIIV